MQKEELRKLRALPATKQMMSKGKVFKEIKETVCWGAERNVIIPQYEVLFRVQNLNGYIKVAVFLPEDMRKDIKTPRYEIFLNVQGEEYITRELDKEGKEVRWLTSMLTNLKGVPYFSYWSNTKYFIGADGMNTLNRLELKKETNKAKGAYRLQAWQQEQKDKETLRREEREQAPWDEDMALVPKIVPSFEEWMRKDVCKEIFIFYEYKRGGASKGYCSRCKREVNIKKPIHGKETRCPACGAKATFKASGKIKTLATDYYEAEIIQKIKDDGIVIRRFEQRQWYSQKNDYRKPNINTSEMERILILKNGITRRYAWESYKNKKLRWCLDREYKPTKRTYYWSRRIKLYKKNLSSIKKTTLLKHSAIDLWDVLPTSVTSYIEMEKGNPAIEMLAKLGMFTLAKEIIDADYDTELLNQDATEIARMLKIDNARLKRLKAMDGGLYALKWMQFEKLHNTIWPDDLIRDFGKEEISTAAFNFLDVPISFVKCHNYLKKQAKEMEEDLNQTLMTWRDYICMADQMKMNTKNEQIAKPKNLKEAHDRLVMIQRTKGLDKKAKELEKKFPKVNKQLPKLQKYEYTLGEYCVVAPKNVLDIVTEGVVLGHCIHTCDYYFSRIQTDETYIFFLRKKNSPDMPWYTLEVEPSGNIRQKRTTGDKQNKDLKKALPFLQKWQQYFKKQLTKKEKKLGEKANILRQEEYKKLRKDGNKVWHGPLAGKLLADVLEADFMEAI